ncbi:hypothetical protein HDV06_001199 [Boothiomyces sp. JEL0866]|nr:hypothetical protein HDV06_001199 [Boothiomyces sp. JEL0866]
MIERVCENRSSQTGVGDSKPAHFKLFMVIILISILSGVSAGVLMMLLKFVAQSVWKYSNGYLIDAIGDDGPYYRLAVFMINGIVVGILLLLFNFLSGPSSLTGLIWHEKDISFVSSVFKAVISIVSISLGASLGREAAPQLVGGSIANEIFKKCVQFELLDSEYRLLVVSIGAGSSFAAVYQLPLGAALFTLEIWQRKLGLNESIYTFIGCAIATVIGMSLKLALPYSAVFLTNVPDLLIPATLIGIVNGFWISGFVKITELLHGIKPRNCWQTVFYPIFGLTVMGGLCIPYPQLAGNGSNLSEILFTQTNAFDLLVPLVFLKPIVTLVCLWSGIPGGLFTPTLTNGALVGGLIGQIWSLVDSKTNVQTCAFIGATSAISASIQGPLSAAGLTFELVQSFSAATPGIIATVISLVVSRSLGCTSIYLARKE